MVKKKQNLKILLHAVEVKNARKKKYSVALWMIFIFKINRIMSSHCNTAYMLLPFINWDCFNFIFYIYFIISLCLQWSHSLTLREKCPYSECFWPVFSCIRTEYRDIRSIFPYSIWIWENTDQKNSRIRTLFTRCNLDSFWGDLP